MKMRLRPERYRKRTYGAEQSPAFSSLLLVDISRSNPASVCASILSCDYARTCNSPWTVQRMPRSGRYVRQSRMSYFHTRMHGRLTD
jgi:hypothetical protein